MAFTYQSNVMSVVSLRLNVLSANRNSQNIVLTVQVVIRRLRDFNPLYCFKVSLTLLVFAVVLCMCAGMRYLMKLYAYCF